MLNVSVIVSSDGCEARLRIGEGAAPAELTCERLERLAREAGLPFDEPVSQRLTALAERFQSGHGAPLEEPFAWGEPPQHGLDCRLEWEPGLDPTAKPVLTSDEKGRTNHHAGRHYVWVSAGQRVGRLQPATEGTPGRSVRGEAIPARAGNACSIALDATLQADPEGYVSALVVGALQLIGVRVTVSESLNISGFVDFETGDIEFPGSVQIGEGVRDQFAVRSRGDVTIGGLIESAVIETEGSLICRGGMAGKGAGQLLIKGNAELAFLDQVKGEIGGSLSVRREIRLCEIVVKGELLADRAVVLAGRVSVQGVARIGVLGCSAFTPTVLEIGLVPPATAQEAEQADTMQECRVERENLLAKEKQIRSKGTLTPSAQQTLRTILTAVQEWDQRILEAEQERARLEAARRSSQIVDLHVTQLVYPGACLRIGGTDHHFSKQVKGPLRFGWDEQRVPRYRVADGPWRPLAEITTARRHAA